MSDKETTRNETPWRARGFKKPFSGTKYQERRPLRYMKICLCPSLQQLARVLDHSPSERVLHS